MDALTAYGKAEIIKHIFRSGSMPKPSGLWIALFEESGAPVVSTELSGTGYGRVALAPSDTNWAEPAGDGTTSNLIEIAYGAPMADWGRATHFGIFLVATGGTPFIYAPLQAPKNINAGDPPPTFGVGDLVFQLQ